MLFQTYDRINPTNIAFDFKSLTDAQTGCIITDKQK